MRPTSPATATRRSNASDLRLLLRGADRLWKRIEKGRPVWLIASFLVVAGIITLALATGPSRIVGPWDVFTLLAGAWRMVNGQTPHTDFYSPLGVLWIWAPAIAMHVVGPTLAAVHYAHVAIALIGAGAGAFFFFRKLPGFQAFLLTAFITLLLIATRSLGHDPGQNTYAMSYNRVGWALSIILMIVLFLGARPGIRQAPRLDMAAIGTLLGLLFYCKITFFLVAIVAMPLALVLSRELRHAWLAGLAGWMAVIVVVFAFTGVNPAAYLGDLESAAAAQSVAMRGEMARASLQANLPQLAIGLALWAGLIVWPLLAGRMKLATALKISLVVGLVVSSGLAITPGNSSEGNDVPFFLAAGILLLELSRPAEGKPNDQPLSTIAIRGGALALVIVVYFCGIARNDALSIAVSFSHRNEASAISEQLQRFDSASLGDFWIPSTADRLTVYSPSREVPRRINDGLALLRANTAGPQPLAVLANSDPFSFALGWPPMTGGALWFSNNYTFSARSHQPPEQILAGAGLVIYPILRSDDLGYDADGTELLLRLYGPWLNAHFSEIARSRYWVLLRRH